MLIRLVSLFASLVLSCGALASTSGITYQGRLLKPDGSPVNGSATQFKLQIRTPDSNNCLMYEEVQSLNLSQTNGAFSLTINDGTGSRTDATGFNLDRIFANRGSFTFDPSTCASGSSYAPNTSDGRNLVVLFKDETMGAWEPIPAQKINFVPFAFESKQIQGFAADSLLRVVNGSGDPITGLAPLSNAQYTALMNLVNGTSTAYTPAGTLGGSALPTMTSGQVLGWNGTSWVSTNSVPGANSVTTAMLQAGAVTSSTIASGAVGTSQIASNVTINTSGSVGARDFKIYPPGSGTGFVDMQVTTAIPDGSSYVLKWPATAGSSSQVLQTDGLGNLSWVTPAVNGLTALTGDVTATGPGSAAATVVQVGGVTAANVASGANAANAATSSNTASKIVLRDASGDFASNNVSVNQTIYRSGANSITVSAPASGVTSYAIKLPATAPSVAGQVLTSDTAGNASWSTISTAPSGAASGDLSGAYPSPSVAQVGGVTAANVASGANAANAATSANTASKIVLRDASGNFASNVVTANGFTLNNAGALLNIVTPTGAAWTLTLPATAGSAGQVMQTDGSGVMSWMTPLTSASAFVNGGNSFGAASSIGSNDNFDLNVKTNNLPRMTVTAAGNVGIGTTAPSTPLEVVGNAKATAFQVGSFGFLSSSTSAETRITNGWGNGYINFFANDGTTTAERMRITGAGNVGIGTTAPTARLQLAAGTSGAGGAPLKLTAGTSLATPEAGAIEFDGTSLFYTDNTNTRKTLGVAGAGITALTGDVTASGAGSVTATVAQVGGVTAANVASGANAANAATSANTASKIVARDANGDFSARNVSVAQAQLRGSSSGQINLLAPASPTTYSLTFPTGVAASSGQVLTSDTSGNLSWTSPATSLPPNGAASGDLSGTYPSPTVATVGGVTAANLASGANAANAAVSTNTGSKIVVRDGSGNFASNVITSNGLALNNAGSILNIVNPIGGAWTMTLPATAGSSGQVMQTNGSGVMSWTTPLTSSTAFIKGGNSFGAASSIGNNDNFDLNVTTNNLARMTVTAGGNVGIGTTAPAYQLDMTGYARSASGFIVGTNSGAPIQVLTATSGGGFDVLNVSSHQAGAGWYFQTSNRPVVGFQASGSQSALSIWNLSSTSTSNTPSIFLNADGNSYISNNGNVGIGTDAPAYKLDVAGSIRTSSGGVTFPDGTTQTTAAGGGGSGQWGYTNPNVWYMAGNVGIGTTAPGWPLTVQGSAQIKGDIWAMGGYYTYYNGSGAAYTSTSSSAGGPANARIALMDTSTATGVFAGLSFGGNSSSDGYIGSINQGGSKADVVIGTQTGATSYSEGLRITSAGNIGIGTTAPSAKLQLGAGTGSASTAPLKFTSGTLLTTPEDGAVEYNGSGLYYTIGTTRYVIPTNTAAGNYSNVSSISNTSGSITMSPMSGNSVIVNSATLSTSSSTGALIVNGGVGISGSMNASGTIHTDGSLSIGGLDMSYRNYNNGAPGMNKLAVFPSASTSFGVDGDSTVSSVNFSKQNSNSQLIRYAAISGYFDNNTAGTEAGHLSFYTQAGGTPLGERLRITAGGNVGIGTTAPQQTLHVLGNEMLQSDGVSLLFRRADGTGNAGIHLSGDGNQMHVDGGGFLPASDNSGVLGSDGWRFNSVTIGTGVSSFAGNVGIGTTSPSTSLSVNGSISLQYGNAIKFRASDTAYTADNVIYQYFDGGADHLQIQPAGASPGVISFHTGPAASTRNPAMIIRDTGNVGIGSAAPRNELEVASSNGSNVTTIRVGGINGGNPSAALGAETTRNQIVFSSWRDVAPDAIGAKIVGINKAIWGGTPYLVQSTDLAFFTNSGVAGADTTAEQMRITAVGNVGIGTTAPTSTLQVEKSVNAEQGIQINNYSNGSSAISSLNLSSDAVYTSLKSFGSAAGASTQLETNGNQLFFKNSKSTGYIAFGTNGANERLRIDSVGYVGIGTTAPNAKTEIVQDGNGPPALRLNGSSGDLANYWLDFTPQTIASGDVRWDLNLKNNPSGVAHPYNGQIMSFQSGNVGIGTTAPSQKLEVNGTIKATDIILTSDARAKHDVVSLDHKDALRKICSVRPVAFKWNSTGQDDLGVIAQEVREVFPQLVIENPDGSLSVKYNALISPLIASVQELNRKNTELERKNLELESQNKNMNSRLEKLEEQMAKLMKASSKNAQ